MILAVVADYLPDGSVIPCHRVISRALWRLIERDQEFRPPGVRIDTENPTEPERSDPEFAFVPHCSVATTSVVCRAERDLTMAYLPGIHVHLEDALRRRVGTHPNVSASDRHPAGISGLCGDGLQQLAGPIHQPRMFGEILGLG